MNEDTLVVVQAYQGDADQIPELLPKWLHHECPILIVSPADSPVEIDYPGVECRSAGRVGWSGSHTTERQIEHLRIIAEYPQKRVLMHDADSVCLSPELPEYLEDGVFFSNEVDSRDFLNWWARSEGERTMLRGIFVSRNSFCEGQESDCPFVEGATVHDVEAAYQENPFVLQPPYYCTQDIIDKFLDVAEEARRPQHSPWAREFIDWYWGSLVLHAGVEHRSFPDGMSYPTENHTGTSHVANQSKHYGIRMLHSIKDGAALGSISSAYEEWTRR